MKKEIENLANPNETKKRIYKKISKIFILILMTFFNKLISLIVAYRTKE